MVSPAPSVPSSGLTPGEIEQMKKDCTEDNLTASLRAQMRKEQAKGVAGDTAITAEEADKFEKAFADPEFRKLMSEYVAEISDPKNRREQDEYIRQLEEKNDVPEDKDIVRVEKGFVVKFKHIKAKAVELFEEASKNQKDNKDNPMLPPEKEKMFVNVVSSTKVEKPTSTAAKGGQQWSVPHSVGPLRMESDKGENLVPTLDVCFHPEALEMAKRASAFQRLVVDTAREGVQNGFKRMKDAVIIDEAYHVLKGVVYKNGDPPVMILSKEKKKPTTTSAITKPTSGNTAATTAAKLKSGVSSNPAVKKGFMTAKKTTRKKTSNNSGANTDIKTGGRDTGVDTGGGTTKDGKLIPYHTISESGAFSVSEHTMETASTTSSSTRPKSLVVRIDLPDAKRAGELDLDVSDAMLTLRSIKGNKGGHDYSLDVRFNYPVIGDEGAAKWDKVKHILTITVPVVKAVGEDLGSKRVVEVVDKVENENDTSNQNNSSSETPTGITAASKISKRKTKTSKEDDHSRWLNSEGVKSAPIPTPGLGRAAFARDGILPSDNSAAEFFEITGERLNDSDGGEGANVDTDADAEGVTPAKTNKINVEGEFTACARFDGLREGFVFKLDREGLGYYVDSPLHLMGKKKKISSPAVRKAAKKNVSFASKEQAKTAETTSTLEINSLPYEFRQNDRTVTILVQVSNIDKNSVIPAFSESSVTVKFKVASGGEEKRFEVSVYVCVCVCVCVINDLCQQRFDREMRERKTK